MTSRRLGGAAALLLAAALSARSACVGQYQTFVTP
jgi:hypothetical protein